MAPAQLWFFLWEDIRSDNFKQDFTTFDQIQKEGIAQAKILNRLGRTGTPEEYSFFIHSDSMKASVQILSDKAIQATWQLYCRQDSSVVVSVRKTDDPSPNSSRAPSYSIALAARRAASSGSSVQVPEIPLIAAAHQVSSGMDVVLRTPLADLPEDEKVVIEVDSGESFAFSREYVTCRFLVPACFQSLTSYTAWVNSQAQDGKDLTEIKVTTIDNCGFPTDVQLNRYVWQRSLIRGPWKQDFLSLWDQYVRLTNEREATIAQLCLNNPAFTQNCINFIRDLQYFDSEKSARDRLESTVHQFYIGKPYFDNQTVGVILKMRSVGGTLESQLQTLAAKQTGNGSVCASHDLSPVYQSYLGVSWDKDKSKATSSQYTMSKTELSSEGNKMQQLSRKMSKTLLGQFGKKKGGGKGGRSGGGSSESSKV